MFFPIISSCGTSQTTTSSTSSSSGGDTNQQILSFVKVVTVEGASIWGGISYDGTNISITTMVGGQITLKKYDTNLAETSTSKQLTSPNDLSGIGIADHKHIFLNDNLFIIFCDSSAKKLFLFKTDKSGNRVGGMVSVESNSDVVTNDMHLFTDGNNVYISIAEGNPSKPKKIYKYNQYLTREGDPVQITSPSTPYDPLGTTYYYNGKFYAFSGNADNHNLIVTIRKSDFSEDATFSKTLITSQNSEWNYFSTGAAFDSTNTRWYIGYINKSSDGLDENATIEVAAFDENFGLLEHQRVTGREYFRPHFLLLNGYLYMVYDGKGGVYLSKYSVSPKS